MSARGGWSPAVQAVVDHERIGSVGHYGFWCKCGARGAEVPYDLRLEDAHNAMLTAHAEHMLQEVVNASKAVAVPRMKVPRTDCDWSEWYGLDDPCYHCGCRWGVHNMTKCFVCGDGKCPGFETVAVS